MSSLGQLVAGIAHEINNPVNFIYANLDHVQTYAYNLLSFVRLYQQCYAQPNDQLESEGEALDVDFILEDFPKLLNSMKIGTERIRQIVLSLRNFSRMDQSEVKVVDIHEGIESTLMILGHRLKPTSDNLDIEVIRDYGDLPLVECYAGQLNQVFMNILANAIDAIEEAAIQRLASKVQCPLNRITIRTSTIDHHHVQIAIADTGLGISEAIQGRIFDPFFTTKPVGKGTGMGMAISYKIITEKHNGKLTCVSEPGVGTEFFIQIPTNLISQDEVPKTK